MMYSQTNFVACLFVVKQKTYVVCRSADLPELLVYVKLYNYNQVM
jgi:hypothetical protein